MKSEATLDRMWLYGSLKIVKEEGVGFSREGGRRSEGSWSSGSRVVAPMCAWTSWLLE